jgi:SET domain-containing protein
MNCSLTKSPQNEHFILDSLSHSSDPRLISKCWEKKEIKRTTMYLLISLGSLECDKLSSMVW